MDLKKIIAQYLRDSAEKIEKDSCGMTDAEINQLAQQIMHQEMNKTEAAEFLNMSIRNFDRKIENGEIPPGQHIRGSKSLIWYKDELIK